MKSAIVPSHLDHGTSVGRPPFIPPHRLNDLNKNLMDADGEAEDATGLSRCMIDIANEELVSRNMVPDSSLPCVSTLDTYNLKATSIDNSISMVKQASLMHKTVRRQVAARSVRNCMSHICAIAYSHFVPTSEKYHHPLGIMEGATKLMRMVETVTGTFVRPIKNIT